jgi:hypothetical protein
LQVVPDVVHLVQIVQVLNLIYFDFWLQEDSIRVLQSTRKVCYDKAMKKMKYSRNEYIPHPFQMWTKR